MKSEIRNPKAERNPKTEARISAGDYVSGGGSGSVINFGFRISRLRISDFTVLVACWLATLGGTAWAQTNPPARSVPATKAPATNAPQQELDINSDSGFFDGETNQMVYIGHVFVTDHAKARLNCERLTISLPPNGGNPTNILAETNVVVEVLDERGETNHITASKAVYAFCVISNAPGNIVTNETVTFSGDPMPVMTNTSALVRADPMIMDVPRRHFSFPGHVEMHYLQHGSSATNGSPFQILK
jgi:hypothetical protein